MYKLITIIFFLTAINFIVFSQPEKKPAQHPNGFIVSGKIIDGDTLPCIYINPVYIFPKHVFASEKDYQRYLKLIRNIKKVYPYAKLANQKLIEINEHLNSLKTKKEKDAYIAKVDNILRNEFEEDLKKLTVTQGRLLLKLIDRETGNTTYEIVKELKGTFSAFFWQSVARLFGSNLKSEYDPEKEDKLIEEIIIKLEAGQL